MKNKGLSVEEAAKKFDITPRTMFRVMRRVRNEATEVSPSDQEIFLKIDAADLI